MCVITDFDFSIDQSEIIRLLGYKNNLPDEDTIALIQEEIEKCSKYIKPRLVYEKVNIKSVSSSKVLLENDIVFEGKFIEEKLAYCAYIVVAVTTLGQEVDEIIQQIFDSDDYLRAMIVENIATTALSSIGKLFWNKMVKEIDNTGLGITSRISPGDTAWEVKEQEKLFACLSGQHTGVSLTNSFMMQPLKSTSAVYGFGEGIGITRFEHVCSECTMKNCIYKLQEKIKIEICNGDGTDTIMVNKGSNLFGVLRDKGSLLDSPCGGNGTCGKCKIQILKGNCQPTQHDLEKLSIREINSGIRLACKIEVTEELSIYIESKDTEMRVLTSGIDSYIDVAPYVFKRHLVLEAPCLDDQRDDIKRIFDGIGLDNLKVDYNLMPKISEKLRAYNFDLTACVYKDELYNIEEGDTSSISYGIAIDIGTTTIACYLINLISRNSADVISEINRQKLYGADVISRINYTIKDVYGTDHLKEILLAQINEMLEKLCGRNELLLENIYNTVIVGNTTMIQFLLGISSKNIAEAPFAPTILKAMELKAKEAGIKTNGIISILPGISGFVGSDITAGILSSGMLDTEDYSILLDIGTNGEIAAGNCNELVTCSTAAGPAFEGANIKCGIGGVKGAISRVHLLEDKMYETIGGTAPIGICGSGVLDIVAEFIRHGIIDETGRMLDENEIVNKELVQRLVHKDGNIEFILEETSPNGEPIVFTQKDVREVQLAKAAISAGIQILLKEMDLSYKDITNVFIGGGFGNFMDLNSAAVVGLIPKELTGKIKSIGNCAGTGAKMYLISKKYRNIAKEIAEKANYVELSSKREFQDYYINSIMFEEL